jgi:hypothetical protein
MEDHAQLYKEAAFVGISLVPMWFVVTQFTLATKVLTGSPQLKAMLDVVIAGSLYHLAAEESGLNHYYLTNSYAYQKSFSSEFKKDEHCPIDIRMDWGGVGAGGLFGL